VIVFRWLTGSLPWDGLDLIGKMTAVTSGARPSALALRPELPAAVDTWLNRALAVEPGDRFQTGHDFYRALEAALRGEVWSGSTDISSVIATPPPASTERKGPLAVAWSKAASLLKRFTNPLERLASEPAPPAAAAPAIATEPALASAPAPAVSVVSDVVDEAPVSERQSIWLDSTELEELLPTSDPAPLPAIPAELEQNALPVPKAEAKRKAKAKRKAQRRSKKSRRAKKPRSG